MWGDIAPLNQIHKLHLSCKDTKNKDIPHKELRESFNIIRVENVIIKMKTKQIKLTSFLAGAIHMASDTGLNTGIASFSINQLHPWLSPYCSLRLFLNILIQMSSEIAFSLSLFRCFAKFAQGPIMALDLQHSSSIYHAVHFPPFVLTLKECE